MTVVQGKNFNAFTNLLKIIPAPDWLRSPKAAPISLLLGGGGNNNLLPSKLWNIWVNVQLRYTHLRQ